MDKTIDMLQLFYGGVNCNNSHNVDGIYKATWAIFLHISATEEIHDHSYCPTGKDSWCKYSRGIVKNQLPPTHKLLRIPIDLAPYVKPVFEDLSKWQLTAGEVHRWCHTESERVLQQHPLVLVSYDWIMLAHHCGSCIGTSYHDVQP